MLCIIYFFLWHINDFLGYTYLTSFILFCYSKLLLKMDMTPKSSGNNAPVPRRFSLNATHYKHINGGGPIISSPLATSSPMMPFAASADRPYRRPPPQPNRAPFFAQQQHQTTTTTTMFSTTAMSDSHQNKQQEKLRPTSRTDTFRSADLSSLFTTPEEAAFENRHSDLLQSIQAQRELVEQAAAAIAFCRKKYSYNGTLQELSSQRLLLVSQERLSLYNRQMDELKDHRYASNFITQPQLDDIPESVDFETDDGEDPILAMSCANGGRMVLYSLFIDKFLLHLNPSFCMKKIDKESSYAFIVLCRYGDCIHATQVANVLDIGELRNNKVKIKELIVFDGIPHDFCVMVEVFAMKISKRMDHKWQSVWDFAARTFRGLKRALTPTPSNANTTTYMINNSGHSKNKNASAVGASFSASSVLTQQQTPISSEFHRCGYLHLTRDKLELEKEKFFLSDADYPLEGTIEVFARFAATDSPMAPPRPDSADRDLRMCGVIQSTSATATALPHQ